MRLPRTPATSFIAAATVAVHVVVVLTGMAEAADMIGGFIPARASGYTLPGTLPVWITPLTATLLHGGLVHLGFNMLMLIFCGRMVEAVTGSAGLVVLYLIGAYAAAGAQYLAGPYDLSPMIGASGAISAIFAAYALLYGRPRGFAAHPRIGLAVNILWLAAAWIGVQFLMGLAFADMGMSIATAAHVGGFIAGLALIKPVLMWRGRKG
ncbi:rhomboid family protein [Sphingomonas sp. Root710]|uniref:rhomboid family intramembrane serine protease n=1 Tax=Sphingomonas sp. Root710 TaxID=1736594 RepID=UPI000701D903|nr:rhomboid family intramembrane serine protease [Sphingomonas sp. Root710]KRB85961.1 rhomboid family protein [Sphingomonas sp. Root710]